MKYLPEELKEEIIEEAENANWTYEKRKNVTHQVVWRGYHASIRDGQIVLEIGYSIDNESYWDLFDLHRELDILPIGGGYCSINDMRIRKIWRRLEKDRKKNERLERRFEKRAQMREKTIDVIVKNRCYS